MPRKVCILVNSRANYGRIKSVLRAVEVQPQLELCLVVGASALLYRFGNVREIMEADGFTPSACVYTIVEGETPTTMAKSTGVAIMELATIFENLRPDIVLAVADRFETIATAIAASYMNIPVAHTQGGETTGSIDESVRHAVSKLSHLHFPATKRAADYLMRMGEDPASVFLTGCPSIDLLKDSDLSLPPDFFTRNRGGVGHTIDATKPYIVVLQHPVTTEYGAGLEQINQTVEAVTEIGVQTIWLWPNVDAGSEDISKGIRMFRERNPSAPIHFYRNLPVEDYNRLINNCACLVGNSSSALREGAYLGTPAVNVGTRQSTREHGPNVRHSDYSAVMIADAIRAQIAHGRYPQSDLFGDGRAGERIAEILASAELRLQKRLNYD